MHLNAEEFLVWAIVTLTVQDLVFVLVKRGESWYTLRNLRLFTKMVGVCGIVEWIVFNSCTCKL